MTRIRGSLAGEPRVILTLQESLRLGRCLPRRRILQSFRSRPLHQNCLNQTGTRPLLSCRSQSDPTDPSGRTPHRQSGLRFDPTPSCCTHFPTSCQRTLYIFTRTLEQTTAGLWLQVLSLQLFAASKHEATTSRGRPGRSDGPGSRRRGPPASASARTSRRQRIVSQACRRSTIGPS